MVKMIALREFNLQARRIRKGETFEIAKEEEAQRMESGNALAARVITRASKDQSKQKEA